MDETAVGNGMEGMGTREQRGVDCGRGDRREARGKSRAEENRVSDVRSGRKDQPEGNSRTERTEGERA
jgi:hypothetical protein